MMIDPDHRSAGARLRTRLARREPVPHIGIYDVFSGLLAGRQHDALFVSGFGFAASHYGLPDIGFVTWSDIVGFVSRLRAVLPRHDLLVDIDDGYGDPEVAAHVVVELERVGASGVVLEDQRRPRRCGHFDGKLLLPIDEYVAKLRRVLAARRDVLVVARTDASEPDDIAERLGAYARTGADVVLVDGVSDLALVRDLARSIDCRFAFNQIAGGKSPACTLGELREAGVSLVIYSTPCLFAAQQAITDTLAALARADGRLVGPAEGAVGVAECKAVMLPARVTSHGT
jgi:2-methylisocitrate lyase-like PEP mutase family enzyme